LADERKNYIEAVDRHFLELARNSGKNWLDIGSGDGLRAVRLNQLLEKTLTLMEPSRLLSYDFEEAHPDVSVIRSTLSSANVSRQFDLVSMLWNVVGHLNSLEDSLRRIHGMLAEDGVLFLDANSPFNVRRFGLQAVFRNLARKGQIQFSWPESNSPGRVNFFGSRVLSEKLKSAGFDPSFHYIDYDNGLPALSEYTGSIVCTARKRRP
jgi:SAM-dependent methyltransferase